MRGVADDINRILVKKMSNMHHKSSIPVYEHVFTNKPNHGISCYNWDNKKNIMMCFFEDVWNAVFYGYLYRNDL